MRRTLELDLKPRNPNWSPDNYLQAYKSRQRRKYEAARPVREMLFKQIQEQTVTQREIELDSSFLAQKAAIGRLERELKRIQAENQKINDKILLEERRVRNSVYKIDKLILLQVYEKYRKYGLDYSDLMSGRKDSLTAFARFECFYRFKMETTYSLPQIGAAMGGKDHTTVLHGVRKYKSYQRGEKLPKKISSDWILPEDYLERGLMFRMICNVWGACL